MSQIDEHNADKPQPTFTPNRTVCLERGVAPPTTTTEYRVALVLRGVLSAPLGYTTESGPGFPIFSVMCVCVCMYVYG